jgi:citrate synthase
LQVFDFFRETSPSKISS